MRPEDWLDVPTVATQTDTAGARLYFTDLECPAFRSLHHRLDTLQSRCGKPARSLVRASAERKVAAIPHRDMLPSFEDVRADESGHVWM